MEAVRLRVKPVTRSGSPSRQLCDTNESGERRERDCDG
jgi:hypothetical protein